MDELIGGIIAFMVFLGLSIPIIVIGVVYYFKKRLEHKQIMAAIEKGTPLSEVIPPKPKPTGPAWIKHVTAGIALLIIGLGWGFGGPGGTGNNLLTIVLVGIGLAWLIRGLLYRKYQPQIQPLGKNNAVENKNSACAATPESQ